MTHLIDFLKAKAMTTLPKNPKPTTRYEVWVKTPKLGWRNVFASLEPRAASKEAEWWLYCNWGRVCIREVQTPATVL